MQQIAFPFVQRTRPRVAVNQIFGLDTLSPYLALRGQLWVQITTSQYLFYPPLNPKSKLALSRTGVEHVALEG